MWTTDTQNPASCPYDPCCGAACSHEGGKLTLRHETPRYRRCRCRSGGLSRGTSGNRISRHTSIPILPVCRAASGCAPMNLLGAFEQGRFLPGSILVVDITGLDVEESGMVWEDGDADRIGWPVPGTLAPARWLGDDSADVMLAMHELDGRPCDLDPRRVLRQCPDALHRRRADPGGGVRAGILPRRCAADRRWRYRAGTGLRWPGGGAPAGLWARFGRFRWRLSARPVGGVRRTRPADRRGDRRICRRTI